MKSALGGGEGPHFNLRPQGLRQAQHVGCTGLEEMVLHHETRISKVCIEERMALTHRNPHYGLAVIQKCSIYTDQRSQSDYELHVAI